MRFGADANEIELARADVDDPLPAGNAELARGNDEVLAKFLAHLEQQRVSTRVQQALLAALPDGAPSKTAIARKLGMSARTLQRHLADEAELEPAADRERAHSSPSSFNSRSATTRR